MGFLELPMPEMGKGPGSIESQAKKLEARIRAQVPKDLRDSVTVRPSTSRGMTSLRIEFDDRAEQMVYVAIEYPHGSKREESAAPEKGKKDSC